MYDFMTVWHSYDMYAWNRDLWTLKNVVCLGCAVTPLEPEPWTKTVSLIWRIIF